MKFLLYLHRDSPYRDFGEKIKHYLRNLSTVDNVFTLDDIVIDQSNWQERCDAFNSEKVDFILAVGDTGTFLRAVFLQRDETPVLSASPEKLSFFTELTPNNYEEMLNMLIDGKYTVEKYERLELSNSIIKGKFLALNEIAIFPRDSAILMQYTLSIDQFILYRGRADGLIISTPIGSTGYALSSGGPIAFGKPEITIIVPVNPLNKDHIPVVVPSTSKIHVMNLFSRVEINAIIDGQLRIPLKDEVKIRKSSQPASIVRFEEKKNIIAKLRNRLVETDLRNLHGIPPSAKYIFRLLISEGEMTQKEIIEATGLPTRTVRNALRILKEKGVVAQRPYLKDARQSIYYLA